MTKVKAKAAKGLQFIVTTPSRKSDEDDRRLVRSHVVRRRHQNKARKELPSWINGSTADSAHPAPHIKQQSESSSIPGRAGSDLSFLQFSEVMQPYMLRELVKLISWAKEAVYPFELCVQTEPTTSVWFEYLTTDTLYLHSMLFSTLSYSDLFLGKGPGPLALLHFAKTLKLLQERISMPNDHMAISDPTIMVITNLATVATCGGDSAAAINHMMGLSKIVDLRGGLQALNGSYSRLPMKVCRTDLAVALRFGNKPILFRRQMSWDRYTSTLGVISGPRIVNDHDEIYQVIRTLDERLVNVWDDLREFCRISNLAYETGRKISTSLFNEVLISTFYRLLHLSPLDKPLSKAIRFSMLAFGVSIFLSSWQVKQPYDSLIDSYRKALLDLRVSSTEVPASLLLWLLLLWHIVTPSESSADLWKDWLREVAVSSHMRSWLEAKKTVKSIMWVDFMNDEPGRRIYENINLDL